MIITKILNFFLPFYRMTFGIAPLVLAAGISAAGSALSGLNQGAAAEEEYKRRQRAYNNMLKKANETEQAGETAFNNVVNTQNPYLAVMQRNLNDNTNKDINLYRNQLNTALAQQGIRGGQAATQMARGLGNVTTQANQDLNTMLYNDQQNNRNLQAAYNQAKALAGLNAGLQQFQG